MPQNRLPPDKGTTRRLDTVCAGVIGDNLGAIFGGIIGAVIGALIGGILGYKKKIK